jgi:hypothetical protein
MATPGKVTKVRASEHLLTNDAGISDALGARGVFLGQKTLLREQLMKEISTKGLATEGGTLFVPLLACW